MPRQSDLRPLLSSNVATRVGDNAGGVVYGGGVEGSTSDIAFGGPTADFILYGVVNGAFTQGPRDANANIDPQNNPLPYWSGPTQVSGGAITCQWVADTASPSGYNLRFTLNAGAAADEAYVEQIVPIGGSRARWIDATAYGSYYVVSSSAGGVAFEVDLTVAVLDASGTVLSSFLSANSFGSAEAGTVGIVFAEPTTLFAANAALIRLRVSVKRYGAGVNATGKLDITDLRLVRSVPSLHLSDQANLALVPGYMAQFGGIIDIAPQRTIGLSVAPTYVRASAALIFSGMITPSISADRNDWAPAGLATCSCIQLTMTGAGRTITGFDATGFSEGQIFTLSVSGSGGFDATFAHASASSSSGNRISSANAANLVVRAGGGCIFQYMPTLSAANPFRIIASNA